MTTSNDYMRGWLRAFFDGEGGCYWYDNDPIIHAHRRGKHHSHKIEATNTDLRLVETADVYLEKLGIDHKIRGPIKSRSGHRPVYRILIGTGTAVLRFSEVVGFTTGTHKAKTLAKIVDHVQTSRTYLAHRTDLKAALDSYKSGKSLRMVAKAFGYKSTDGLKSALEKRFGRFTRTHRENAKSIRRDNKGRILPQVNFMPQTEVGNGGAAVLPSSI